MLASSISTFKLEDYLTDTFNKKTVENMQFNKKVPKIIAYNEVVKYARDQAFNLDLNPDEKKGYETLYKLLFDKYNHMLKDIILEAQEIQLKNIEYDKQIADEVAEKAAKQRAEQAERAERDKKRAKEREESTKKWEESMKSFQETLNKNDSFDETLALAANKLGRDAWCNLVFDRLASTDYTDIWIYYIFLMEGLHPKEPFDGWDNDEQRIAAEQLAITTREAMGNLDITYFRNIFSKLPIKFTTDLVIELLDRGEVPTNLFGVNMETVEILS